MFQHHPIISTILVLLKRLFAYLMRRKHKTPRSHHAKKSSPSDSYETSGQSFHPTNKNDTRPRTAADQQREEKQETKTFDRELIDQAKEATTTLQNNKAVQSAKEVEKTNQKQAQREALKQAQNEGQKNEQPREKESKGNIIQKAELNKKPTPQRRAGAARPRRPAPTQSTIENITPTDEELTFTQRVAQKQDTSPEGFGR